MSERSELEALPIETIKKKSELQTQVFKNDESVLVKFSSEPYIGPYWGLDQCSVIVTH